MIRAITEKGQLFYVERMGMYKNLLFCLLEGGERGIWIKILQPCTKRKKPRYTHADFLNIADGFADGQH